MSPTQNYYIVIVHIPYAVYYIIYYIAGSVHLLFPFTFPTHLPPLPPAHYLEMQAQVSNVHRTYNGFRSFSGG